MLGSADRESNREAVWSSRMDWVHMRGQLFEAWEGFTEKDITESGNGWLRERQWLVYKHRNMRDALKKWRAIWGGSNSG